MILTDLERGILDVFHFFSLTLFRAAATFIFGSVWRKLQSLKLYVQYKEDIEFKQNKDFVADAYVPPEDVGRVFDLSQSIMERIYR